MDQPPSATVGQRLVEPTQESMEIKSRSSGGTCTPELFTEERCCARVRTCMPRFETRNALLDNFKGLCSLFVVIQHSFDTDWAAIGSDGMPPTTAGKLAGGFMSICMFVAMPGFSFVSGFLSTESPKRKQLLGNVRLFLTYLIQHLLFLRTLLPVYQAVATAERSTAAGIGNDNPRRDASPKTFPLMFFTVFFIEWYILAVVIWRAFLPMIATLRFALPISLALSIASFFLDVSSVDQAQVTFAFLPYFLAGFRYKGAVEARFKELHSRHLACFAFPIFASVCVISAFVVPMVEISFWINCLYGGFTRDMTPYMDEMGNVSVIPHVPLLQDRHCMTSVGVAESLAFYAISALGIASLLLSLPDRPVPFLTKAGENAIYIYLTQVFFLDPMKAVPRLFMSVDIAGGTMSDEQAIAISVIGGVCTWLFLATGWITYFCSPCVEPPVDCCAYGESDGP